MPVRVTLAELTELERILAVYHATHARLYRSQPECTDVTCVEGKWAIEWLSGELLSRSNPGQATYARPRVDASY